MFAVVVKSLCPSHSWICFICDLREALAFHKRGAAFYINGVIFGFSHGREPLQLLHFLRFAHGCVIIIS